MNNQNSSRLKDVRDEMARLNLDAFIIPHEDEYLLEEVSEYNNRLKWLSGFSGTAGVVVVLKDEAIMFVDGRYKVQVSEQVDEQLYTFKSISEFENNNWLEKTLNNYARIGVDLKLHAYAWYKTFTKILSQKSISCIAIDQNLIDLCWKNRPDKQPSHIMANRAD
jgi:Xaa-Pro aminopeptidase